MASLGDVSSDEEDMLGTAVSFYAQQLPAPKGKSAGSGEAEDDDDDDDDTLELPTMAPKSKRKRSRAPSRPKKQGEPVISLDSDSDIDIGADTPTYGTAAKKKAASVFTASDDVVDVDLEPDEVNTAASKTQIAAERLLQQAKHQRKGLSLEAQLDKEAEMAAKHQALILDKQREMERKKAQAEKAAAERTRYAAAAAPANNNNNNNNKNKPPSASADSVSGEDTILLRVRHGARVVKMKTLKADPLLNMLKPFCTKIGIELAKAVMEVDGEEVEEDDTANTYELEDNNIVEVRLRKK